MSDELPDLPMWHVRLRDTRDGREFSIKRWARSDREAEALTLRSLGEDASFFAVLSVLPA